jgi:hypothetical protein
MTEDEVSSIRLKKGTKALLEEERHGRETDDNLIQRLLKELQEYRRRCG